MYLHMSVCERKQARSIEQLTQHVSSAISKASYIHFWTQQCNYMSSFGNKADIKILCANVTKY